jgi:hypothetical protein
MSIEILIPVLARPARAAPLIQSLRGSLRREETEVRELFLCTEGDQAELEELARHGFRHLVLPGPRQPGDYARKINHGARHSDADWWFLGADDLNFRPGWLRHCLNQHDVSGALVIGTNDLGNLLVKRGRHATHSLVHRSYLEQGTIDEPGKLLHEGYAHNCVDVEFVETAMHRGVWSFAREAEVEHLHPLWRKGAHDATYTLGQQGHLRDRELLRERGRLWHHRDVMLQQHRRRVRGDRQIILTRARVP